MKKIWIPILACIGLDVIVSMQSSSLKMAPTSSAPLAAHARSNFNSASSSSPQLPSATTAASAAISNPDLKERLRDAIKEVAKVNTDLKIDTRRAYHEFPNLSRDEFLKQLPEAARPAYEKLLSVLSEAQNAELRADGKDRSFFDKKPGRAEPKWMQQRLAQLDSVSFDAQTEGFVTAAAAKNEIQDDDIRRLVELCRQERRCIEKGTITWIRANHEISPAQFKILGETI